MRKLVGIFLCAIVMLITSLGYCVETIECTNAVCATTITVKRFPGEKECGYTFYMPFASGSTAQLAQGRRLFSNVLTIYNDHSTVTMCVNPTGRAWTTDTTIPNAWQTRGTGRIPVSASTTDMVVTCNSSVTLLWFATDRVEITPNTTGYTFSPGNVRIVAEYYE